MLGLLYILGKKCIIPERMDCFVLRNEELGKFEGVWKACLLSGKNLASMLRVGLAYLLNLRKHGQAVLRRVKSGTIIFIASIGRP